MHTGTIALNLLSYCFYRNRLTHKVSAYFTESSDGKKICKFDIAKFANLQLHRFAYANLHLSRQYMAFQFGLIGAAVIVNQSPSEMLYIIHYFK